MMPVVSDLSSVIILQQFDDGTSNMVLLLCVYLCV